MAPGRDTRIDGRMGRFGVSSGILVSLVLALGLLTGCSEAEQIADEILQGAETTQQQASPGASPNASGSGPSQAPGAPAPPSAAEARQQLSGLTVAAAGSEAMAGYSRELFPHWASDGSVYGWNEPDGSCDVRDDALIRDGKGIQVDEDCSFVAGQWTDPYTGGTYTDSSDMDIDHVVPLANAWRSGASGWSTTDQENYANDPQVLLSVEDNANQEKGDKGPEAWAPPNRAYWCEYGRRWIYIKGTWGLTITSSEEAALDEMLETCRV